jgi:actinin alpha
MLAMHDNLDKLVDRSIQDLESAILAGKNEGISEEQLKDFRETFNYFDKDKDAKLNKLEFKACCASLGEDVDDNDITRIFKEIDLDSDGSIEFDEFKLKYMNRLASEGLSYEGIVDSFKQLAGDKDYITASELTSVMDQEEAEYLLSVMPKKEGVEDGYDFYEFAKQSFGKE